MSIFLSLLSKLFPLYATMGAGAFLARRAGNLTGPLAQLQIYLILPVVAFVNMTRLEAKPGLIVLPLALFAVCTAISGATYALARRAGSSYTPLLAQASGAANLGYLGVPVAVILFPPDLIPAYIFTLMGGVIYENTVGYYWLARGHYSARESLIRLLKMPTIYAIAAGLVLNAFDLQLPAMWDTVARDFLGAYVVLGALIIGFGVAQNEDFRLNARLLGTLLGIKFLVWPAVVVGLVAVLALTPFAVPDPYAPILLLMSFMPLAANTAAFAALLKIHPEEAATAVALSTVLSLAVIPAYVVLFELG